MAWHCLPAGIRTKLENSRYVFNGSVHSYWRHSLLSFDNLSQLKKHKQKEFPFVVVYR